MCGLVGFGDADSFYASAEAVRRPWLAGAPVGVLGNQGACVIARNYQMRPFGVKVGTPVWEAKKLCPEGVFLKRDFKWYETLSRKMLAEVGTFTEAIEYFSIDEFFWVGIPARKKSYQQTAVAIRDHVKAAVGVPMTVTFGRTRTLAKLFADVAKPFGALAVSDPQEETERLATVPVTEIAGVAKRSAARLEPYGIKTCLDFRRANGGTVKRLLTVVGFDLWREMNGEPVTGIRADRPARKVIARGGSLAGHVSDAHELYGWLARNAERLVEELEHARVKPARLGVHVHYQDGVGGGNEVRLAYPSALFPDVMDAAKRGLRSVWRPGQAVSRMHLIATDLRPAGCWQPSLFDAPDDRHAAVARVKREINDALGRFTVRSGATLYANRFYDDPANLHDICDVRGKFCF